MGGLPCQQFRNNVRGLSEIFKQMIGRVRLQLGKRIDARSHANRLRPDRSRASDVCGRIADDAQRMSAEIPIQLSTRVCKCHASHVVAMSVIVAETAGRKILIQPEVPQLDPCAIGVVTGEQTEMHAGDV